MKGQGSGLTSPGPARTSLGYLGRRTPLVVWVERRLPYFAGWDVQPRLKLARSKNTSSVASLETCRLMQRGRGVYWIRVFAAVCGPTPFVFAVHSSTACSTDPHTRQSTDNAHFIHSICTFATTKSPCNGPRTSTPLPLPELARGAKATKALRLTRPPIRPSLDCPARRV